MNYNYKRTDYGYRTTTKPSLADYAKGVLVLAVIWASFVLACMI